jgi:hypothetical protein
VSRAVGRECRFRTAQPGRSGGPFPRVRARERRPGRREKPREHRRSRRPGNACVVCPPSAPGVLAPQVATARNLFRSTAELKLRMSFGLGVSLHMTQNQRRKIPKTSWPLDGLS